MAIYKLDFRIFTHPFMITMILLLTYIIGVMNSTTISKELNKLPQNRNETLPFKNFSLKQNPNSNWFEVNIEIKCALPVTQENIIQSMKIKLENEFYQQILPVFMEKVKNEKGKYRGLVYLHSYGRLNITLMYMYVPLLTKEFTSYPGANNPSNTLVTTLENPKFNHLVLSRVCEKEGKLYIFSQEPFEFHNSYSSLGNASFEYLPTIKYNYNDFMKLNPETKKVSEANLFIAETNNSLDWATNIIMPLTMNKLENNNTNYVVVDAPSYGKIGIEESLNIAFQRYNEPICFDKADLFQLDSADSADEFLRTLKLPDADYDSLIVNIGALNYNEALIDDIRLACNLSDVIYINEKDNNNDNSYIYSLIYNAKCFVSDKLVNSFQPLSRGIVFSLINNKNSINSVKENLREEAKWIGIVKNEMDKIDFGDIEKAIESSSTNPRQIITK